MNRIKGEDSLNYFKWENIVKSSENFEIDCFQNLEKILLSYYKKDLSLIGANWPWRYYHNTTGEIRTFFFLTPEALRKKYALELKMIKFSKDNLLQELNSEVLKHPFIINVDQYYLKHHYINIYHKSHGPHSLLLVNAELEKFEVIGCLPSYHGYIGKSELIEAIISFPNDNKGYLRGFYMEPLLDFEVSNRNITKDFLNDIQRARSDIQVYRDNLVGDFYEVELFLTDIYEMVAEHHKMNKEQFGKWYEMFSKGQWYWNIERPGKAFSAYIESMGEIDEIKKGKIVEQVASINLHLMCFSKLLYKYYLVQSELAYEKAINNLEIAMREEDELKKKVLSCLAGMEEE